MKRKGKTMKIIVIAFAVLCGLLSAIYMNHRICLRRESELLVPLGRIVDVNGHNMSVYMEGSGEETLVFMSGGGTCSPILDFKSLYSLLSDKYRIVVVEKLGYGFSDVVDTERNLEAILDDTRSALKAAGINGPFVLCPHSMSGLEALYWAQKYPEEVSAIIGLDIAVPEYYDSMAINMPLMRVSQCASAMGITRVIPGIAESEAIKHGTLTEEERRYTEPFFIAAPQLLR